MASKKKIESLEELRDELSEAFVLSKSSLLGSGRQPKASELQALAVIAGQLRRVLFDITKSDDPRDGSDMTEEELKEVIQKALNG